VHQRPALQPREDRAVDGFFKFIQTKNHSAARPAQCFMVGGGDVMRDAERRRIEPGSDQPGVMRDVGHEERAAFIGDGAKALPVDRQRIGGGAGDDQLGLLRQGHSLGGVVVDLLLRS
jgi:hypothetical protein